MATYSNKEYTFMHIVMETLLPNVVVAFQTNDHTMLVYLVLPTDVYGKRALCNEADMTRVS